ncbi:MAG: selenium metabolism-associated LysR family transcriptional regulator [Eubacteriales bacterium]|nr:selenium metabolism-associated LysR family transcriptional regulator [Eubacteriales bacterium]
MISITIKQLEVFVAIVEAGSFTRAANRLYMAQSTISGHIQSLEKELGVTLFRRDSKRNIQLTEIGRRIYDNAVVIIDNCHALADEILIDKRNELIIGASTVPAACILPFLISGFSHYYPEARFTVRRGDSGEMHQLLAEHEIHLAFVGSNVKHHSFQYDKVANDAMVLITPAREPYLSYKKQGVYGREFLTHPLLFREAGSGSQKVIDDYLTKIGIEKNELNVVGRFENSQSIINMVGKGVGLAMISQMLVENTRPVDDILVFPLEKDIHEVSRSYHMLSNKKFDYPDLHKAFISYVRRTCKYRLEQDKEKFNL